MNDDISNLNGQTAALLAALKVLIQTSSSPATAPCVKTELNYLAAHFSGISVRESFVDGVEHVRETLYPKRLETLFPKMFQPITIQMEEPLKRPGGKK